MGIFDGLTSIGSAILGKARDVVSNPGQILDTIGKYGGQAIDYVKANPNVALGAASGVMSAADRSRTQDLENKGIGMATDAYNEKAGLRGQGLGGLMSQARPDLSNIYRASGNPFESYNAPSPAAAASPTASASSATATSGASAAGATSPTAGSSAPSAGAPLPTVRSVGTVAPTPAGTSNGAGGGFAIGHILAQLKAGGAGGGASDASPSIPSPASSPAAADPMMRAGGDPFAPPAKATFTPVQATPEDAIPYTPVESRMPRSPIDDGTAHVTGSPDPMMRAGGDPFAPKSIGPVTGAPGSPIAKRMRLLEEMGVNSGPNRSGYAVADRYAE